MELFIFILGLVVGWHMSAWRITKRVLSDPDSMIRMLEKYKKAKIDAEKEEQSDGVREMKVERHGDMLYLFAKDNDEFLAQGTTLQEAISEVEKRFPNQTFRGLLSKDEADSLGIKA